MRSVPISRRRWLAASAALLAAPAIRARARDLPVLGVLSPNVAPSAKEWAKHPTALELARLGWIDSETLSVVHAYADGREDRLAELADHLVRRRVDVIWARGPEAAVAAARATQTIAIVFGSVAFPVEMGLIDSLARPGRNLTGVAYLTGDGTQAVKSLEYLRLVLPGVRRIASLWSSHNLRTVSGEDCKHCYERFDQAVSAMGFELRIEDISRPGDYEPAFARILSWRPDALLAFTTPLNWRERGRIIEFAKRNRLPSAHDTRVFVEAGGLLSFGPVLTLIGVQCMRYIDRILRGARPAELAVELPTQTELAVNLLTARELGLTVPQSLLLRADRLVQ